MDAANMEIETTNQLSADALPFARSYQVEALDKAIKQNTIVFLETGSGKTLIAIMLLRSYAYLLRKPSPFLAVFLVPQVVLVTQQAEAVKTHTELEVGIYWGDMGVDYWDASMWKKQVDKFEVLVMTPAILLNALRHSFLKLNMIKVLIFDECHHARGNHDYACIMREFYHCHLKTGTSDVPRIFGMTASPIKTKCANSSSSYWKKIHELETLMNSKVYTCASESVLARFIPFSTPKFKFYQHMEIPYSSHASLVQDLQVLRAKHDFCLKRLDLDNSAAESIKRKMSKIYSSFLYCLNDLGVWLAFKAAQALSTNESDFFQWGQLDVFGEKLVKNFALDASQAFAAYIPSDPGWKVADDIRGNVDMGLLTMKTVCLLDSLLEYSALKDIRCIVFVERVIAAVVLQSLLAELLPKYNSWKTKYIAGKNNGLKCQTREKQNEIVEEFRRGMINIIVATSILEEGLDVQSCNLVIRFDPSETVCSFIQSRGRARMQNSVYLLMVKSGDFTTHSRLQKYLSSGNVMREVSLSHASVPCPPLQEDPLGEDFYHVASTGAIVTLSSSVGLLYFYCSRLPSDGYFRPAPRCEIDKERGICTLYLPKSCPIKTVSVQGNISKLKQAVCLQACKQLHGVGALTDNLVPDTVIEEASVQELGNYHYSDDQPVYFPPELVSSCSFKSETIYHVYLIELKQNFHDDILVHDILLGTRSEFENDVGSTNFELEIDKGTVSVSLKYVGVLHLSQGQVLLCRRFQVALFKVLLDHHMDRIREIVDGLQLVNGLEVDYLLLPSRRFGGKDLIDWEVIQSVNFHSHKVGAHVNSCTKSTTCILHTKDGPLCSCMVQNALVYTPHNGRIYCISGILDDLKADSLLNQRDGTAITYKAYYKTRYGIQLDFVQGPFLKARHIFHVQNYLHRNQKQKKEESSRGFVELPPELCQIILSPVSISTIYSYTFLPSVMHRLESLLIASNLKKMHLDHSMQNVTIPTIKVLEAITSKKCQEKFHLESLETLGDSFLKYVVCQHLFKTYQNHHEGLLSAKKDKMISNAVLCSLGCQQKLPGFICSEAFDPKMWMVPGRNSESFPLSEEDLSNHRKMYIKGRRNIKRKKVADVVEALVGAYLIEGGESAALVFLDWVGIKVNITNVPYERESLACAEKLVNLPYFKSLFKNYLFRDPSLLVEALTHGSYMLPEISRCYQRLEFLGDAVLDYLITRYLYDKYPGMSPGLLTDMRSASVNNDCYAHSAVKAGLHKHILHASHDLHKHIVRCIQDCENLSSQPTFGWDSDASFPKVLGDVIESLAGAILVDSGYNKDIVFANMRPLLEPMISPETVTLNPSRELSELCQRKHYSPPKEIKTCDNGVSAITVEVEADGMIFRHTSSASNKETAKRLACKQVLKALRRTFEAEA